MVGNVIPRRVYSILFSGLAENPTESRTEKAVWPVGVGCEREGEVGQEDRRLVRHVGLNFFAKAKID